MIPNAFRGPVGTAAAALGERQKLALLDIHELAPNFRGGAIGAREYRDWGKRQAEALLRRGLVTAHDIDHGIPNEIGWRPTELGSAVANGLLPRRSR